MLMERADNHTLHLLVRPDIEESVVEFSRSYNGTVLPASLGKAGTF